MKATPALPSGSELQGDESPLAVERRQRIVELVCTQGSVRVAHLCRKFAVSEVTIRTDLRILAGEGVLVRTRGGAIAQAQTGLSIAFGQRALHKQSEKQRIGRAAAALVRPGDTILLDAGTTLMEMAKSLPGTLNPLTVVTNALNIASQVGGLTGARVILIGGSLSPETISTLGTIAERDISELMVDKLFLGAHALDAKMGVADMSVDIARVKLTMIHAARQVIVLADSTKWGRSAFARVAPLSSLHTLITDNGLSSEARQAVLEAHINLMEV